VQVVPCNAQEIQRGDVIVFFSPVDGSKVIHRVVSLDSYGIRTQGDNCNQEDQWILSPNHILGRVVSTQRGSRRRRIFGGPLGQLFAATIRVIDAIDSSVSFLFRPVYNRLARVGIFRRLMPVQMKAKVISYHRPLGTELQLLMGRRVIGRWLPGMTRWRIRKPFRLFVDEESLPENPGKASVVPPEADQLSVANRDI
jgi:hypothetical protein